MVIKPDLIVLENYNPKTAEITSFSNIYKSIVKITYNGLYRKSYQISKKLNNIEDIL